MDGEKTVGEIVDEVKQSQPAVSQHLATLKSCGLVLSEKRGQEVIYSIDVKHALALLKNLSEVFSKSKVTN
jgi:DNA-binding transcriptional ArsR family regulator